MGERKHSDVEQVKNSHHHMLASVLGSKEAALDSMIYSYRHGFSAFAAKMTEFQAKHFKGLPGVVQVFPSRLYKLHTTRSWVYLGHSASLSINNLPYPHDTNQGDGAIIGVIDAGVRPESKSFDDKGLGPIRSKWKGSSQSRDQFNPSEHCNKKLIGARFFSEGFLSIYGPQISAAADYLSPREHAGHGTHCASIAGGSFVTNVSFNGLAQGTARGGAPRARIAADKVSWINGTYASSLDVLKAFDEAINDGVDIWSVSPGKEGSNPVYIELYARFRTRFPLPCKLVDGFFGITHCTNIIYIILDSHLVRRRGLDTFLGACCPCCPSLCRSFEISVRVPR